MVVPVIADPEFRGIRETTQNGSVRFPMEYIGVFLWHVLGRFQGVYTECGLNQVIHSLFAYA